MTIFFPWRSCFATIEARRPRRWPFPSTTTTSAISTIYLLSGVIAALSDESYRKPPVPIFMFYVLTTKEEAAKGILKRRPLLEGNYFTVLIPSVLPCFRINPMKSRQVSGQSVVGGCTIYLYETI